MVMTAEHEQHHANRNEHGGYIFVGLILVPRDQFTHQHHRNYFTRF